MKYLLYSFCTGQKKSRQAKGILMAKESAGAEYAKLQEQKLPESQKPSDQIEKPPVQPGVPIDVPAGVAASAKPPETKPGEPEKPKDPERAPDAMTGTQFVEAYKQCKSPEEKQRLILAQVAKGALSPESLKPKTYETIVNGQKIKVKMLNNLAIGVPGDSVRICTDAFTSQAIADMLGGALPTKDFQKRLYDDPSVPRVPFFTGEQLEARVNAKRREQGLPPLNINIETSTGTLRNGAAMESGDYMEAHSRMLDEWLTKHGIDKDKVTAGSGKTVLAPYADDGMLVFGGGLYAKPVIGMIGGEKRIVDYEVTGRIVQDIGDKAHGKIYADYSSRLDVVLSVEIDGKEVKGEEFMKNPKYASTRAELFGAKSGPQSRYTFPGWMQEMVDEYKKKEPEQAPEEVPAEVAVLIPGNKQQIAAMPSMQVDIAPDAGSWRQQVQQIHSHIPKGYNPPSGNLPKEVVAAANDFLDIKPFGSMTPFEYKGQRYLAVKDWHPPHTQEQGPPYVQHHGVTIFVGQEGAPAVAVEPAAVAPSEPAPQFAISPSPESAPLAAPAVAYAPQLPAAEIAPVSYGRPPKKSGAFTGGSPSEAPAPAAEAPPAEKPQVAGESPLAGFEKDPATAEFLKTYNFPEGDPDPLRIHLNAPKDFDAKKPTRVILYALPAANSIEQTIGKKKKAGQDFHFEIQQLAAQLRKLRESSPDENVVLAYIETPKKDPSGWRKDDPKKGEVISALMSDIKSKLSVPDANLSLSGHSAGRSLECAYIDSVAAIPDNVKRISFLDANHAYTEERGNKMMSWLQKTADHYLTIISYDDRNVKIDGKPVSGAIGYEKTLGTIEHFRKSGIELTEEKKGGFTKYSGMNGRVNILIMDNPGNKILHTETVFRNGFIYAETAGTPSDGAAGQFNGPISFESQIQTELPSALV